MTGTELDEIMSEPAATTATEITTTETATQQADRIRDEQGRFAAKEAAAAATTTTQAATTTAAETTASEAGKTVPIEAVHASREKEREARTENDKLRADMARLQGQIEMLSKQREPVKEAAKAPDFWEDPNGFVQTALDPVQKQLAQQAERFSMRMAIKEHGQEAVQGAYQALGEAMQAGDPSAKAEYQRIKASDDPYDEIVKWHKRNTAMQKVGNDPDAWLEAEMEKRLADPAYQVKLAERLRTAAAAGTDRSNPPVILPPSLSRLPGGGNAPGEQDTSDAGLFAHATR